ncbi:uncharacterized protein ISCGN_003431 [Ixodes scapularis]
MLDRLRAKVLAAMRLIQRVSSRRRGIREEGVLRLVQAFALGHIMYVGPYLKWWKAELNKLDAMVRKACRAGLGVLSFTHNADLDALGVHNSVTEMIEAHREAQELRLAGTAAGREILARVGVSRGNTGLAELPNETMRCVKVRPIPRHMHPTRDAGRRAARAQALKRLFLKSGGAVCVDAAVRDGVGVAVVTDLATGEIKTALSAGDAVQSSSPGQLTSEGEPTLASSRSTDGPTSSRCHTHHTTEEDVGSSLRALTSGTMTSPPTRVHGSSATRTEGKGKMDVLRARLRQLRKHNKRL